MADLGAFALSDMVAMGASMRAAADGARSMEEAAQAIVSYLYDHLRHGDERNCVLVRFYRTLSFDELEEPLQQFARGVVDDDLNRRTKSLTLLASRGERPEWNDRHASVRHQAVPLASEDMVARFPMVSQLMQQFGVQASALLDGDPELIVELDEKTYNVFYVPEALGSPHIPDQDFVRDWGVRSVLGFGGMLPTGDLFAAILFSRTPIPPGTAELFRTLALNAKVAVLPFASGPIFSTTPPGSPLSVPETAEPSQQRTHRLVIEQLLEVHEHIAREQAIRLERANALEQRRSEQLRALAEAGVVISSTLSLDQMLERITEQARLIVGAHQSVTSMTTGINSEQPITVVSLSDRYAAYRDDDVARDGSVISALVCETDQPLRLTQEQLDAQPRWRDFDPEAASLPPMRGLLAVPLKARTGANIGVIQLSDRSEGEFTPDDEAILVQFAQLASVSIENARTFAREHEVAMALQESLLPQGLATVTGLDSAARYVAGTPDVDVGGDWYDLFAVTDTQVVLVIGDVVGHDLRAAAEMGQLRSAIRAYGLEDPSPAAVVERVNRFAVTSALDDLATLVYLLLDVDSGRARYVNAGHPPPLLLDAQGRGRYVENQPGMPVGSFTDTQFDEHALTLEPGSTLLLYTDGLVERRGESLDVGLDRLLRAAERRSDRPAALLRRLLGDLTGERRSDDIAMLAVRRSGSS